MAGNLSDAISEKAAAVANQGPSSYLRPAADTGLSLNEENIDLGGHMNVEIPKGGTPGLDKATIKRAYDLYHSEKSPDFATKGMKLQTFDELTTRKMKTGETAYDRAPAVEWAKSDTGRSYLKKTASDAKPASKRLGQAGWGQGKDQLVAVAHGQLMELANRYMDHWERANAAGTTKDAYGRAVQQTSKTAQMQSRMKGDPEHPTKDFPGIDALHGRIREHLDNAAMAHANGDHAAGMKHYDAAATSMGSLLRKGHQLGFTGVNHGVYDQQLRVMKSTFHQMMGA